jgi:DNA-binding NarL/FixJ family response regulator
VTESAAPLRVAVADDHPVFRAGLRGLIEDNPALEFTGAASDGDEAVALCIGQRPDVVLLDIHMPGMSGIEATRRILAVEPTIGVLMLTMLEDDTSLFAALRAGARGYIVKGADPDQITRAIMTVAAGEIVVGATLASRVSAFFRAGPRAAAPAFPALSPREHDILDLVAGGHSNHVIAARLALSEKTVRNNVSNIFAKLQVTDRAGAIVRARDAGLGGEHPATTG